MSYLYRAYVSTNPAGIIINDGYYALLACLIGNLDAEESLYKVCGVPYGDKRQFNRHNGLGKSEEILRLYKENPAMPNSKIATIVDCTREMVRHVLKRAGVPKRNRWDNHKSLDMRYWK